MYVAGAVGKLNFTLPPTAVFGFRFGILSKGVGGWSILSGANGQYVTNTIASSVQSAASAVELQFETTINKYIEFVCTTENSEFTTTVDNGSKTAMYPSSGYTFAGGTSGETANDSLKPIESLNFTTEATALVSQSLSVARSLCASVSSLSSSYILGGFTGSAQIMSIEKYGAIDNSISTMLITLSSQALIGGNSGCQTSVAGYVAGGNYAGTTTAIRKISYTTEVLSVAAGSLSTSRGGTGSIGNSVMALFCGGNPDSPSDTYNIIDKFTYGSETCAVQSAVLAYACNIPNGVNYDSGGCGYFLGGGGVTERNIIQKLTLATTPAISTISATLTAVSNSSGCNSRTAGYGLGGIVSSATSNIIQKLTYATEAATVLSATMQLARERQTSTQIGGIL